MTDSLSFLGLYVWGQVQVSGTVKCSRTEPGPGFETVFFVTETKSVCDKCGTKIRRRNAG